MPKQLGCSRIVLNALRWLRISIVMPIQMLGKDISVPPMSSQEQELLSHEQEQQLFLVPRTSSCDRCDAERCTGLPCRRVLFSCSSGQWPTPPTSACVFMASVRRPGLVQRALPSFRSALKQVFFSKCWNRQSAWRVFVFVCLQLFVLQFPGG